MSFRIFLLSGAIAGLAGSIEVSGVTFALYENISPGYGYTAIAVALIAALNPAGVIASGVFFGVLETGAIALQRELAIPSSLASVAEAALILAVLSIAAYRGQSFAGLRKIVAR
jgi:simple sugar transport system permease protein